MADSAPRTPEGRLVGPGYAAVDLEVGGPDDSGQPSHIACRARRRLSYTSGDDQEASEFNAT